APSFIFSEPFAGAGVLQPAIALMLHASTGVALAVAVIVGVRVGVTVGVFVFVGVLTGVWVGTIGQALVAFMFTEIGMLLLLCVGVAGSPQLKSAALFIVFVPRTML